ncbi:MAG: PHP domain-containing protein [Sphaerochaetaceae bacterium]
MKFDAHCHTDCSDGNLSIVERMQMILSLGFDAATITDHDFVSSQQIALAKSVAPDLPFVPGIEISALHSGKSVHVLGYFINPEHPSLIKYISEMYQRELSITKLMLSSLSTVGVDINLEELKSNSLHSIHYLRLLKVLAAKVGYDRQKTFNYYMNSLFYHGYKWLDFYFITVREAIDLIHSCGGVSVLAHPGYGNEPFMGVLDFLQHDELAIRKYVEWGLDGIEVHSPSHSNEDFTFFLTMADKYQLLVTEGSDCHGNDPYLGPSLMDTFNYKLADGYEKLVELHENIRTKYL